MKSYQASWILLSIAALASRALLLAQDESAESTKKAPGPVKGVPAEVLTREIEANVAALRPLVESPEAIRSGHREAARRLTTLAVILDWLSRGGEDAPYAKEAAFLRDKTSAAAKLCKTPSEMARETTMRLAKVLTKVMSGEPVAIPDESAKEVKLAEIADRGPLMQRSDEAFRLTFAPAFKSEDEFLAARERLLHEGHVTLILMAAAHDPSRELADDAEYKGHASRIAKSLQELIAAAEDRQYEHSRRAYQAICVTCANCHASFR